MNLLSLFSGIEGFAKGFEMAGFKFDKHYTSEIDKYANAITRYNYPDAIELGSVTGISGLKDIDIVTFGFPCQDLSIAGNRAGFKGSRSSLFFEAMRIIQETKPRVFVFENVKGLFSSNGGADFITVLRTIAELGLYECEWQLVNTRWVLPQNRERVYFIGHLRGNGFGKVFPIRENAEILNNAVRANRTRSQTEYCATPLRSTGNASLKADGTFINEGLNQIGVIGKDSEATRVYDTTIARTIKDGGGMGAKTGLYKVHNMLPRSSKSGKGGTGHLTKNDGTTYNIDTGNTNAIEVLGNLGNGHHSDNIHSEGGLIGTLRAQIGGKGKGIAIATNSRIRRLTPIECERLQGFPDNWTKYGIIDGKQVEISDTQRYKTLGNAVTTKIVQMIADKLIRNSQIEN